MADVTNRIIYLLDATQAKAEAQSLNAELAGMGKAAQSSAAAAAPAINSVAAATQSAAAATSSAATASQSFKTAQDGITQTIKANQQSIRGYNETIATARADLANLGRELRLSAEATGQDSIATQRLRAEYAELAGSIRIMSGEKAILAAETASLKAQQVEEEASTISLSQQIRVGAASMRIFGEAGAGMGRSLSVLAGGLTAAGIGQIALIVGISLAIGKIIEWVKEWWHAKDEIGKATLQISDLQENAIVQDQRLVDVAKTEVQQRIAQAKAISDVRAQLVGYFEARRQMALAEDAETKARERSTTAISNNTDVMKSNAGAAQAFMHTVEDTASAEAKATSERQKQSEVTQTWVAALVRANATGELTMKQQDELAQKLAKSTEEYKRYREEIERGAFAQKQFNDAVDALRIPKIDASATTKGLGELEEQLTDRINQQKAANMNQLESARLNKKALQEILDLQKELNRTQATAVGITLSDTEQKKRLASAVEKMNPELREQIHLLGLLDEKIKGKDITPQLRMEVLRNENKLETESLETRIQNIHKEFDIRREEARKQGELSADAVKYFTILEAQATDATIKEFQKRAEAQFKAEREVTTKLRDATIEMEKDVVERERQRTQAKIDDFHILAVYQFGESKKANDLTTDYAKVKWAEFYQFREEHERKVSETVIKEGNRVTNELEKEFKDFSDVSQKYFFDNIKKSFSEFEKDEKVFSELTKRFTKAQLVGGEVRLVLPNAGDIEKIQQQLKKFELSVHDVDQQFGNASKNAAEFQKRLDFLTETAPKATTDFQKMTVQMYLLAQQMINSKTKAQEMFELVSNMAGAFAQSFTTAFNAVLNEQQNFFKAFLAAFLTGMTTAIGQWMVQHGTMLIIKGVSDVLMGIAFLANPFLAFWGPGLIAAGTAEIVQGTAWAAAGAAVMAVGAYAANKVNPKATTGTAGGTGAATTTPETTARPPVPPNVIPFPTSGTGGGGGKQMTISLDRAGTKDFLKGEKVVTMDSAKGEHKRELKRAIG